MSLLNTQDNFKRHEIYSYICLALTKCDPYWGKPEHYGLVYDACQGAFNYYKTEFNESLYRKIIKMDQDTYEVCRNYMDNFLNIKDTCQSSIKIERKNVISRFKNILLTKLEKENASSK